MRQFPTLSKFGQRSSYIRPRNGSDAFPSLAYRTRNPPNPSDTVKLAQVRGSQYPANSQYRRRVGYDGMNQRYGALGLDNTRRKVPELPLQKIAQSDRTHGLAGPGNLVGSFSHRDKRYQKTYREPLSHRTHHTQSYKQQHQQQRDTAMHPALPILSPRRVYKPNPSLPTLPQPSASKVVAETQPPSQPRTPRQARVGRRQFLRPHDGQTVNGVSVGAHLPHPPQPPPQNVVRKEEKEEIQLEVSPRRYRHSYQQQQVKKVIEPFVPKPTVQSSYQPQPKPVAQAPARIYAPPQQPPVSGPAPPSNKAGISPAQCLKLHGDTLTRYEQNEILRFPVVYFWGPNASKIHASPNLSYNSGYDDERGDYKIIPKDHFCYRYEVINIIGRGSFGQVVKAYDFMAQKIVALKIIRNKKRFHHQGLVEVKILEYLRDHDPEDSTNIVRTHESFYFRNHLCVTFELLSINLYEFMKNNNFQGMSLGLIRKFTIQLLNSLRFMYSSKIVHCDMKPENILLKDPLKSGIKVIDFGSSCLTGDTLIVAARSIYGGMSHVRIDEISIGQKVLTFNSIDKKFEVSVVKAVQAPGSQYTTEITNMCGVGVVATFDHKFLILNEKSELVYREARDLEIGDKCAYVHMAGDQKNTNISKSCEVLLDFDDVLELLGSLLGSMDEMKSEMSPLKSIFPLYSDDHAVCVLARVLGIVFATGHISFGEGFHFALEYDDCDTEELSDDLSYLCGDKVCLDSKDGCIDLPRCISLLCLAFGVPAEDGAEGRIPDWLLCSDLVACGQFVAAFHGALGSIPFHDGSVACRVKLPLYCSYVDDLVLLYYNSGIEVTVNKNSEYIELAIAEDEDNLLRLCECCGVVYETDKKSAMQKLGAYLSYRLSCGGDSPMDISKWSELVQADMGGKGVIFVPIVSLEPRAEPVAVFDITTESENHNFVAGGYITHNCFEDERIYTYIQSRFYRSPEVILGLPYGMPIDIWSLGCILAELFTGYPLFPGENEVEQLGCIMEVFGVPPSHLIEKSGRRKLFFDSSGNPRIVTNSRGRKRRPGTKDLGSAISCSDRDFLSFLEGCLRWNPSTRFTPDQALQHPWIMEAMLTLRSPNPRQAAPHQPESSPDKAKYTQRARAMRYGGQR